MDNIDIDIQIESKHDPIPSEEAFMAWAKAALEFDQAEITIRVVDEAESEQLNSTYRKKSGPTNVLSFPFAMHSDEMLHGDIVICAPLVQQEANDQNKPVESHWAHLVVHGILHLQGYDHIDDQEAEVMEQQEIAILRGLGLQNPYE